MHENHNLERQSKKGLEYCQNVEGIEVLGNMISCDNSSTYRNGNPIGTEEFLLIDTETREYEGVR